MDEVGPTESIGLCKPYVPPYASGSDGDGRCSSGSGGYVLVGAVAPPGYGAGPVGGYGPGPDGGDSESVE